MQKHHVTERFQGSSDQRDRPLRRRMITFASQQRWSFVGAVFLVSLGALAASLPTLNTKTSRVQAQVASTSTDKPDRLVKPLTAQPDPPPNTRATGGKSPTAPSAVRPSGLPATRGTTRGRTPTPAEQPSDKPPETEKPGVAATGTLAISSSTSVDIYKDDAYLGSVPISLALPEGTYTLEYRHGNLRKNVTYVVNGNETTRATVTFDVNVRINAKPWADVFIDDLEKTAIGQTPLSDVRIPIGTVLVFENPQFQPRKYRVTGGETGIQIVFQER